MAESAEDNGGGENSFLQSYSDAMNDELKGTTLQKSFIHANQQITKKDEVKCVCETN